MTEPSATNLDPQAGGQAPATLLPTTGRAWTWAQLAVLAALALTLTLPDITDGGFRHSDASRHAMDGVFVYDFVRDLPQSACHPVDYTLGYYAQYPALGIVLYYPPFFAIVEAIFFALFGISPFSARLTVVFFAVLAAVMMYKLLKAMFNSRVALVATALFLALPTVVFWSRQTMLEMPTTAMVLVATWFFYRYVEAGHRRSALWTGLAIILAVMTKQPALFILPAFGLYVLIRRKWNIFRHWQLYVAMAMVVAVLAPYFYFSIRYASYLVARVSLTASPQANLDRLSLVLAGWTQAVSPWLLWPGLACAGACVVWEWVRPRWSGTHLAALLALAYLLQSVVLAAGVNRYVFIILPMLACFPPLLLARLGLLDRWPVLAASCAGAAALAVSSYLQPINVMSGHQQAMADLVARNGSSRLVLFEGYWDGDAVFFTRQADPQRRLYVLRGSKMLYSYASFTAIGQMVRVHTPQEVRDLIRNYGIHAIAIENRDVYADKNNSDDPLVKVRRILREVLQDSDQFELIARCPIRTRSDRQDGAERLQGADILVYRVKKPGPPQAEDLVIPMVGLDLAIRVPLKGQGKPSLIALPRKETP